MADRFLIAPLKSGLITSLPAWQIPEDAFSELNNAYIFRGRILNRIGSVLTGYGATSTQTAPLRSRLRVQLIALYVPAAYTTPINVDIGQQFSIGVDIFTVNNPAIGQFLLNTNTSGLGITAQITGVAQVTFVGASVGNALFLYPGLPVMGITTYEIGNATDHPTIAFDINFAYQFVTNAWIRITGGDDTWSGTNLDYFWSCNWRGTIASTNLLFTTNYIDPIRYWDNTTWTNLTTPVTVINQFGDYVITARIIVPFQGRLVLLSTEESIGGNPLEFKNRARWSISGSPIDPGSWLEPNQTFAGVNWAGAGFQNAPTEDRIISAQFVRDRLIVYFENSTWELVFTANDANPFVWQQLNNELGAMSIKATVPFDKAILGIAINGVHACNGVNVERIDEKIPDQIFTINKKNDGATRVAGIRDYISELVFWAYPDDGIPDVNANRFNNKMLVYNYSNNTWSIWDDSFTAFGYFYQQQDTTWSSIMDSWEDYSLAWNEGLLNENQRVVVAGNQQGYIVELIRNVNVNAQSLTVTDIDVSASPTITLTIINHNLLPGDTIEMLDFNGITGFVVSNAIVISIVDQDTITIVIPIPGWGGIYTGGGTVFRVSRFDISTKQWNPYIAQGRSFFILYTDFAVVSTEFGQLTVDYFSSSGNFSLVQASSATGAILGNNILETSPYTLVPFEQEQDVLWHRIYFNSNGTFIQMRLYLTDDQILNTAIAQSPIEIQGLILATEPSSITLDI